MSRIFWDTNLFIYLIEGSGETADRVAQLRRRMLERGDDLFTSALTLGEVLVKPSEHSDEDLVRTYADAISRSAQVVAFDSPAAQLYARIRVDRSIRPPDAIQLACAGRVQADLFVTNDDRLSRKTAPGIEFITSLERAPL